MSGSYFDDVLRDPRRYGIKNTTDKVRRPGAVRRRRDAVCTERVVGKPEACRVISVDAQSPYHKLSPSIRLVLTGQGCVGEMLPGVSQRSPQARRPVAGDPENLRLQSGRSGDFSFPLTAAFIFLESSEGVSQGTRRYLPGSRCCRRSDAAWPGPSQMFRGPGCERWRAT